MSTTQTNIFADRRDGDRRQAQRPELIPRDGCRRQADRRARGQRFDPRPWWLQARYVDEAEHG